MYPIRQPWNNYDMLRILFMKSVSFQSGVRKDVQSEVFNTQTMRNYYRKTERGKTPVGIIKRAAESVINEGISIRSAAKNYEICRVDLKRFIVLYRADSETASFGYKFSRRVFTDEQENVLSDYLKQSAQIYFGLTPRNVRTLAYECAKQFNLKIPDSWGERKQPGADWFTSFLKRQPA
ncbi:hypothetical protein JTB14_035846 [Gonioctena quinquepunctata]|nr:hypothetical protein JTB14_035846 [Gonioctena quinquepunctata]